MGHKISVIIPCYNCETTITRAINSVKNQTIGFENIELILIDNGSTDNTKNIIEKYSSKYENIFLIFIKNNTGSAATPRNLGLEQSTSEYIMFLDADDEFVENFCEIVYKKIIESNVDLVKCNSINIKNNVESYNYYFNEKIEEKIIKNTDLPLRYVTIWNGIHKSEVLKKNNITFPNYMGEDMCFTTEEFLNIKKMLYLNNYFGYKYYDDENSHSKSPEKKQIESLIKAFEMTGNICKYYKREDVMNIILGQQINGIFTRINKNSDSITIKKELLKKLYIIEKEMPNLIIPNITYKLANYLMMKKFFNLTIIYLKIAPKIISSKFLLKLKELI